MYSTSTALFDVFSMDFENLPYPVKCGAFEKFNYKTAAIFEECSEISRDFCKKRSKMTFPFNDHQLIIMDGVVRRLEDKSVLFEVQSCPAVWIEADHLIIADPLTAELCNFIVKRFRGLEKIGCVGSTNLYQLAKNFDLKQLLIDVSKLGEGFPKDFSKIEDVQLLNAKSLSPNTIFSLKSKKNITIRESQISYTDLLKNIKAWVDGKQWNTKRFIFKEFPNFDFHYFITGMSQNYAVVKTNIHGYGMEWRVTREDGYFKHLRVSFDKFSIVMKQL